MPVTKPAVITPVVAPIVAIVPLMPQVPPVALLLSVMACPVHTPVGPVLAVGVEYTVIGFVVKQPAARVYVIVSTPALPPTIRPVPAPIVKYTPALPHVPPGTASVAVVAEPTQIPAEDTIAAGDGFTVIMVAIEQPAPTV